MTDVEIDATGLEEVAVDAEVFEALRQLELFPADVDPGTPPTVEEVLDTLEARLRRKLAGPTHPVWVSLADRLEALLQAKLRTAAASVEFLKQLLELARALVEAEKRDADGTLDEMSVLPDPHKDGSHRSCRRCAPEQTPALIENVVEQIDAIVRPVRGTGWQTSQPGDREVRRQLRLVLSRNGLPAVGELYDRAYAYIREHY